MSHSRFAPSSMHRTVGCNGWLQVSAGIDEIETQDAREGTASHWVCEQMLRSMQTDEIRTGPIDYVGREAPNGVIVTDEMYDAAYTYYIDVMKLVNDFGLLQTMYVETTVIMPEIHDDCYGTPDCFVWDEARMTLHVYDYKYGHGSISAHQNWQLLAYALGALNVLTGNRALSDMLNVTINLNVVQPRCFDGQGPYRRWSISSLDLRNYVNQMNYACTMSDSPMAECVTGSHCKDCPGSHRCNTQLQASVNAIDVSNRVTIRDITPEALVYEYELIEHAMSTLKHRKSSLEADAESRLRSGGKVPGMTMKETYGREEWLFPVEEMISVGSLLGVDLSKPPVIKTPNQARNELKRNNVDPAVINDYAMKNRTGVKLIKDDGSRAERIFSKEKL